MMGHKRSLGRGLGKRGGYEQRMRNSLRRERQTKLNIRATIRTISLSHCLYVVNVNQGEHWSVGSLHLFAAGEDLQHARIHTNGSPILPFVAAVVFFFLSLSRDRQTLIQLSSEMGESSPAGVDDVDTFFFFRSSSSSSSFALTDSFSFSSSSPLTIVGVLMSSGGMPGSK